MLEHKKVYKKENESTDKEKQENDDDKKLSEAPAEYPNKEEEKKELIIQRLPSLPPEKICHGKTFLSEIYMEQILFFSDRQYTEGQSIVIQFNVPEKFILNAEVAYSQSYSLKNRVISKTNLPYRISANFTFLKEGERTLLRKFLENIEFKGFINIDNIEEESEKEGKNPENLKEMNEDEDPEVENADEESESPSNEGESVENEEPSEDDEENNEDDEENKE